MNEEIRNKYRVQMEYVADRDFEKNFTADVWLTQEEWYDFIAQFGKKKLPNV